MVETMEIVAEWMEEIHAHFPSPMEKIMERMLVRIATVVQAESASVLLFREDEPTVTPTNTQTSNIAFGNSANTAASSASPSQKKELSMRYSVMAVEDGEEQLPGLLLENRHRYVYTEEEVHFP